ncbi:putative oxidoreductase MhqP [compost metagenome]
MAVLAGLMEFVGGLLFTLGLLTPLAAALIALAMLGAIVKVHFKNGLWSTANGYEYPLVLLVVVIGIALTGAGAFSVDALL